MVIVACETSLVPDGADVETFDCSNFAYADTIFFINENVTNKVIPTQSLNGTFSVVPEGLDINESTGEIDINKSETGLKYRISFTPSGSEISCTYELTIGGVNYLDKVYILDQNDFLAFPIFNADQTAISPCGDDDDEDDDDEDDDDDDDDDSDDNSVCKFGELGPDNEDISDLGIEVNNSTGIIDLQKTLENGAFGANPVNGSSLDAKLFYRLQDQTLGALNAIDLKIFYFATLADVPQSLLDEIDQKNTDLLEVRKWGDFTNARINAENPKAKPRPPYLLIVARLQ
jgi:hypothetical protein